MWLYGNDSLCFFYKMMIHGCYKCKLAWDNPFVGEDSLCEREVENPHEMHAVAVKTVIDGN